MKAELLYVPDCPSWQEAGARLESALAALGICADVDYRLLAESDDIPETAFAGSPTLLLDGVDLFPGADPVHELTCRLFHTPHGLRGVPDEEQIIHALRTRIDATE